MQLKNKTAVIFGADIAIGGAVAIDFASEVQRFYLLNLLLSIFIITSYFIRK